jgi:hypothetical protein
MPRAGFEPTTPVFVQVKTVNALDRAATVMGGEDIRSLQLPCASVGPRYVHSLNIRMLEKLGHAVA